MDWNIAIGTAIGAVLGVIGIEVYTHLFRTHRVTKPECDARHNADEAKCTHCRAGIKAEHKAGQDDMVIIRKMLHLVASKVGVPEEKLQELVK